MKVYTLKQYSKCIHISLIYINILYSRATSSKHKNSHSDLQKSDQPDKMAGCVNKGRVVDDVYIDFSKACVKVSYSIL